VPARGRPSLCRHFNTFATRPEVDIVTRELDFYINGQLRWGLELLGNGEKLGASRSFR
jgi:hypothetical protein